MVNSGEFWGVELGKWVKGDSAVSLTSIWAVWVFVGAVSEESKECGGGRHPSVLRGCDLQTRLCQGLSIQMVSLLDLSALFPGCLLILQERVPMHMLNYQSLQPRHCFERLQ